MNYIKKYFYGLFSPLLFIFSFSTPVLASQNNARTIDQQDVHLTLLSNPYSDLPNLGESASYLVIAGLILILIGIIIYSYKRRWLKYHD